MPSRSALQGREAGAHPEEPDAMADLEPGELEPLISELMACGLGQAAALVAISEPLVTISGPFDYV